MTLQLFGEEEAGTAPLELVELPAGAEASAVMVCKNQKVLDACDFDVALWTVTDEGRIEKNLWLLGHQKKKPITKGWVARRVCAAKRDDKTDDAESITEHRGHVYVLGSCFGSKKGPLSKKRAFIARFSEDEVGSPADQPRISLEVAREPFRLHRMVNDGLRSAGITLMPLGPHGTKAYLEATLAKAAKKRATWSADVRVDDWPLNVEGMSFVADDVLLLGLRYPVTSEGHPMLLALDGRPGFFDEPGAASGVQSVIVLSNVGTRGRPVGVRGVESTGSELHVLTGPIAAGGKGGALVWDHPGTLETRVEHWVLPASWLSALARDADRTEPRIYSVEPRLVRRFDDGMSVEGVTRLPNGRWAYVIDRDGCLALALG